MKRIIIMKKVIILCTLFILVGCGGQWLNMRLEARGSLPADPFYFNEKNYNVGEIKSAYVGQEIVKVKGYKQNRSTSIDEASSPEDIVIRARWKLNNYQISINKNKIYQVTDSISIFNDKRYYLIKTTDNNHGQWEWGVVIDRNGEIYKKGIYSFEDKMMYFSESIIIAPEFAKFVVQESTKNTNIVPSISYEFIYSGRNDVSLNVTYREFTADNLARPAFFQNLTYQADAKQIRFKDFVIQIHDVTNEKITYTVLADGL